MVQALKGFIVPKEKTLPKNFNVEKEVARCYTHEMKSVNGIVVKAGILNFRMMKK